MSTIEWQDEGGHIVCVALIGHHANYGETEYVHGVIHQGYHTRYGWEVIFNGSASQFEGQMCMVGDTDDLEQAKRECEFYGKEWIKGDSPIWSES